MTDEGALLRELKESPEAVLEALKRDRENPHTWHAPEEAIRAIEQKVRERNGKRPKA